jgi:hypothetical protein
MSASHPSPFSYQDRNEVDENIIGWFMVSYNNDPNHEFSYTVYKDGKILRDYDFFMDDRDPLMFFLTLSDKNIHTIRFVQANGKEVNYKW